MTILARTTPEISIHVPRVEDDLYHTNITFARSKFQSTSPGWRTTKHIGGKMNIVQNFNPRPPGGGRRKKRVRAACNAAISIHVPRVEDDLRQNGCCRYTIPFQSTSPGWRTTSFFVAPSRYFSNFNPRPPGGGRRRKQRTIGSNSRFQSTSPGWRTTSHCHFEVRKNGISIHVPRVEDDGLSGF